MPHQLRSALRDFRTTPLRSILFILQIFVAGVTLVLTLSYLVSSLANVSMAARMNERPVTYFNLYYSVDVAPTQSPSLVTFLGRELDSSASNYSLVVNNYEVGETTTDGPLIAATPGFARFYGLFDGDMRHGVALVGSRVTSHKVGGSVTSSTGSYPVVRRLAAGASFLDPWNGVVNLDHTTVVLLPVSEIVKSPNSSHAFEELVGRAVLVHPSAQRIADHVKAASTAGLTVVPEKLSQRSTSVYAGNFRDAIAYTLLFGLVFTFILCGIGSSLAAMTRRNLRNYAILRLSGARLIDIWARLQWYLLLVFVAPAAIVLAGGSLLVPGVLSAVPFAALFVVLADAALCLSAISIIRQSSIAHLLNRKE